LEPITVETAEPAVAVAVEPMAAKVDQVAVVMWEAPEDTQDQILYHQEDQKHSVQDRHQEAQEMQDTKQELAPEEVLEDQAAMVLQ
jgi:hypothetical protein